MSGGVDSSVAAALLVEEGHEVVGVTMRLLAAPDAESGCCSAAAARDAKRVCHALGIPHYTMDFRDTFSREVAAPFAEAYAVGRTPNPCVACNDRVKFDELLRRCLAAGAEGLATGHYARIVEDPAGKRWLVRGADAGKDQSYFLYRMTSEHLALARFPVGGLTKDRVRRIAAERALPTAEKPDSQEICFVPDDDYGAFVAQAYPGALTPGPVLDTAGRVVGEHGGLARYTVGQRRGLGGGADRRRYVVALLPERNAVVVGEARELEARELVADDVVWRAGAAERGGVAIRHRARPVPGLIRLGEDGTLRIALDEPVVGAAPGQSVVCYAGERVLGGGVLREAR
ncbi:MAG: tRNA 2-thiouridine(34) synthase MnmA [Coriobacteriia bacterium]|nr:tRNA 2-thiouridine(34) synthase MnmA [Coriobacteriia bacterium]